MSKDQDAATTTRREDAALLDRRSMLESSLGAALAATVFGAWAASPAEAGQAVSGRGTAPAAPPFRRVVTGHNAEAKSCVVSDEMVSQGNFWTTSTTDPVGVLRPGESVKLLPTTRPDADPPAGGTRILFTHFPPATDPKPTLQNRRGFHRTATIDYLLVLSGEVVLLLDVEEVTLKTGDVLIQRNTMHSWRNDGRTPTRALAVLVHV